MMCFTVGITLPIMRASIADVCCPSVHWRTGGDYHPHFQGGNPDVLDLDDLSINR